MKTETELREEICNTLDAHNRSAKHFVLISEKLQKNLQQVTALQNQVYQLIIYVGYEQHAKDFLEQHNMTFTQLKNLLEELSDEVGSYVSTITSMGETYKELTEMQIKNMNFWRIKYDE